MTDTQPAGTPAADRHAPRPHERTATCMICELPIVYGGQGRWLHEADGWDDFDPPHAAAPADTPERSIVLGHEGEDPAHVAAVHRLVEQAQRGQWAAAYRWAAGEFTDPDGTFYDGIAAVKLRCYADQVEAGVLTPWADTPEPFTPPATATAERLAGLDPHPDTPGGAQAVSGVLGRALLDRDGQLWPPHDGVPGPGYYRHGIYYMTREQLDVDRGPVREALLVDLAAGRVLEAARALADCRYGLIRDRQRATGRLLDAVDALDRPTIGDPECRSAWEFDGGGAPAVCTLPAGHTGAHHDHDRSTSWPSLRAPAKPAPEPAGDGSGWDRIMVNNQIAALTDLDHAAQGIDWTLPAQLRALLADRDHWAKVSGRWADETIAARNAADAARAELAEVTADRDRWERMAMAIERGYGVIEAERDNLVTQARNCIRQIDKLADEANAHEGELGDMRAQLSAAETETDRLRAVPGN